MTPTSRYAVRTIGLVSLLATTLFVGVWWVLGFGVTASFASVELIGVVAILCLAVGSVVAWTLRQSQRATFRVLRETITALRENPTPHVLHALARTATADDALEPVVKQLEKLAVCHREALAQIVRVDEKTDRRRENSSTDMDRDGPSAGRYVAGSSRHRMVGRLAPNLHWIAATQPLQEFLGCKLRELIARSFLDHVHPQDAAALKHTLQEALKDGEGHNITFRVLVADASSALQPSAGKTMTTNGRTLSGRGDSSSGSTQRPNERHLQMDVMTCYTEAGAALHLRCHILDITDRILTEQKLNRRTEELTLANVRLRQINTDLQRLKESYRDLYHQAPVMYFSLDAWGHFGAFNETMLRTLGYPREALLGQPYTCLLTPPSRARFLSDPSVLQQPGELEGQWVKQDGTVIDVLIDTTTIKDADGRFIRSRSAARDITERCRLSEALRTQAEELVRANGQLRRTNQELEEFTYVVSHDLKEPLRTLQAFSNFLLMDYGEKLDAEGHDHINHLIQASRRLGTLIDDLLSLSRAGRVINTPRAFTWDETLETVLGDLQGLIQDSHAEVRVEGSLPPVLGDPERIGQLLTNLVSNGLKYNKNPKPEVAIGALPTAPQGPITLFVRDNGEGIDPQYHEQIFRIFRRLHRREVVEGTGAGLAICKKVVEAHGGRLWVESKPGAGATFYFTLPPLPAGTRPREINGLKNLSNLGDEEAGAATGSDSNPVESPSYSVS